MRFPFFDFFFFFGLWRNVFGGARKTRETWKVPAFVSPVKEKNQPRRPRESSISTRLNGSFSLVNRILACFVRGKREISICSAETENVDPPQNQPIRLSALKNKRGLPGFTEFFFRLKKVQLLLLSKECY